MATFDLPVTRQEYQPNLTFLRAAVLKDRSDTVSTIRVRNSYGRSILLFLRHSDLYVVGFDFGGGPFHFMDQPAVGDSTRLEFTSEYHELGLQGRTITFDAAKLDMTIDNLSYMRPGTKGSRIFNDGKDGLVRLVFVVSEALRNWQIAVKVADILNNPGSTLSINGYYGNGKALNEWRNWSARKNWPELGIAVRHNG